MGVFGPGALFVTRTDIANQTPFNIGYCQEFSYDEAGETKELYGQNQYPLLTARGTIKATGKIKAATISGLALNACFFAGTFATGQLLAAIGEGPTTIPGTPFQITVTNSAQFDTDLGVNFVLTGLPLIRVASSPAAGQYSVAAGVYTFNTSDATKQVVISYAYTAAASGQKITLSNQPIGTTPSFQLDFVTTLYGATYYLRFFNCVSSKLTRAHKLTDFMMPEIDFAFFANPSGNVYEMTMSTAA
jgi:hypothetical protein